MVRLFVDAGFDSDTSIALCCASCAHAAPRSNRAGDDKIIIIQKQLLILICRIITGASPASCAAGGHGLAQRQHTNTPLAVEILPQSRNHKTAQARSAMLDALPRQRL